MIEYINCRPENKHKLSEKAEAICESATNRCTTHMMLERHVLHQHNLQVSPCTLQGHVRGTFMDATAVDTSISSRNLIGTITEHSRIDLLVLLCAHTNKN